MHTRDQSQITSNRKVRDAAIQISHEANRGNGMSNLKGYRAFFTFKSTHTERHYLVNPRGRKYSTTISRERADAFRFKTEQEARQAMEKLLKAWDYGRDGGYYYCSGVETPQAAAD